MISWLLALVLLSAADAITTPAGAANSQVEPTASSINTISVPDPRPTNPTVNQKIYTNQFVIQVQGGEEEARRLAQKHGFIYLNHILGDYYHLEHRRLARRSVGALDMSQLDTSIEEEPQVLKLERQVLKKRVKRDFIDLGNQPAVSGALSNGASRAQQQTQSNGQRPVQTLRPNGVGRPAQFMRPANQPVGPSSAGPTSAPLHLDGRRIGSGHSLVFSPAGSTSRLTPAQQQYLDQLEMTSSGPPPFFLHANFSATQQNNINKHHRPPPPPIQANESRQQHAAGNQTSSARHQHANETLRPAPFNDPSWPLMWYLDGGARNGFDLNVQAAWKMGYTGKGIVITILDDGLEKDHPDLQANYDPLASFDINNDDADPMPRYDANDSNRHGTRCAGEVAAVPDNNICSIGIAYNSKVGGVRMLDGDVTDAVEARSLGLNNQHIHIYSASWGPDDNGKTVDGPGEMATRAFIDGVTNGRQGLGSIFVFASGNGGREHDNCNCDGYTNSIWTLSISSATENGFVPWYIEACSSTLATTYSSGSYDERQIATTDIRHSCTSNHTGTSASAPIAAGICALVLESNPRLTWRDMQHIVVRTAKPANLIAKDWRTNAMGRNVSHAFGYGLMDAAAMINVAKRWTTVPMQYTCQVSSPQMEKFIPAKGHIELKLLAKCDNVRFLEHVQSKVTLTATRRGDMHIYLTSPSGTRSTLLAQRPNDQTEQGFRNWPFMTVHNWGESPNGVWTLEVHNDGKPANRAFFKEWTLMLYGTNDDPNKHLDMNSVRAAAAASSSPISSSHNPVTSSPFSQQSSTANRAPSVPPRLQSNGNVNDVAASIQASPPPPPPPPSFVPMNSDLSSTTSAPTNNNYGAQQQQQQPMRPQMNMANQNHHHLHVQSMSSPPPPPISNDGNAVVIAASSTPATKPASTTTTQSSPTQTLNPTSHETNDVGTTMQYEDHADRLKEPSGRIESTRTDFDIVSAPTGANRAQSQENGANSTEAPSSSTRTDKPTGSLEDGDKIDGSSSQQATNKPPVGAIDDSKRQQDDIDVNHLDLKLTKDYRSSGEQDKLAGNHLDHDRALNGDTSNFTPGSRATAKHRGDNTAAPSGQVNVLLLHSSMMATVFVLMLLSMSARQTRLEVEGVR